MRSLLLLQCVAGGLAAAAAAAACSTPKDSGVGTSADNLTSADAAPAAPGDGGVADSGAVVCTSQSGGMPYSKYRWPFFGNLHQHTSSSLDAYSFGTRNTPDQAYLFAKANGYALPVGPATTDPPGPTVTLDRPLDFLAVTDHSEWMGLLAGCTQPDSGYYGTTGCAAVRSTDAGTQELVFEDIRKLYTNLCGSGSATAAQCTAEQKSAWVAEQTAAANAYEPCTFTSLIAYEWTSTIGGDTNHRNVIFGTTAVPTNPLDSENYSTLSDLFTGLDQQCTGSCTALVIPHNTNMSQGVSLVPPSSSTELEQMQKYQRLVEVYQHKGSSECFDNPEGGTDPNCAFEYLNPGATTDVPNSYVRTALENGIGYAVTNDAGANPLQLGIIASTDDHNGIAGYVDENNYVGHVGRLDDQPTNRLTNYPQYGSGGLAGVWAEQNTRDAIFSALERRETFGTSGPRILLRVFQTSAAEPCSNFPQDIIDNGTGIPMGGTFHLSDVSAGARFVISAWPDSAAQALGDGGTGTAGLQTLQVIKAQAKVGADGGAVIVEDAPVDIPIAARGACVTWKDMTFDPTQQAFYYVRVLQVPTWRWSHFDCQAEPSTPGCEPGGTLDVTLQERAWSSPIWYTP